jgi:hypothetical protein
VRTMLKVRFPVKSSNEAVKSGVLEKTFGKMLEQLKPEAAYFFPDGGLRAAIFVFDMKDPSDLAVTVEPFFTALNAEVYLVPVMNAEDLKGGLTKLKKAA